MNRYAVAVVSTLMALGCLWLGERILFRLRVIWRGGTFRCPTCGHVRPLPSDDDAA